MKSARGARVRLFRVEGEGSMAEDMTRACAIIVAGGSGTRFGNPGGKLLIEVAGKPLITWTR